MVALDGAPALLDATPTQVGASQVGPSTGELWVLSWDGRFLGLACIAETCGDFVLAWPTTLSAEPHFAPALEVPAPFGDEKLYVWPTRETGIGNHLLDRPLGKLLEPELIDSTAIAARRGRPTFFPYASGSATDPANREDDAAMVEHWANLCFHTHPAETDALFLSEGRILKRGGSPQQVAEALGVPGVDVRDYWLGTKGITPDEAASIAAALGLEVDEILGEDPYLEVVRLLNQPRFKADVTARAAELGVCERTIRDAVRADYALAARDDSPSMAEAKLHAAIRRVEPLGE